MPKTLHTPSVSAGRNVCRNGVPPRTKPQRGDICEDVAIKYHEDFAKLTAMVRFPNHTETRLNQDLLDFRIYWILCVLVGIQLSVKI